MSKKKDKIQKRTTYQPKEEEEETVKEKVYPAFEIPDFAAHLNLFFPRENTYLQDHDSSSLDTAQHPVNFIYNNDNYDRFLGFKMTSHPPGDEVLQEFFFVTMKKDEDVHYNDSKKIKDVTYMHCAHIEEIEGFVYQKFDAKAEIIKDRFNQIMTDVITKHVLLQEESLVTKDKNTDDLLSHIGLTRKQVMESERYRDYQDKLSRNPYRVAAERMRNEIAKQQKK